VGTPHTLCDSLVLGPHHSKRRTRVDPREDLVGGHAVRGENSLDDDPVVELQRFVMPRREEGAMHRGEVVGVLVAHDDTGLQRDDPAVLVGLFPDARLAVFDVDLAQRERQVAHLPVGAGGEAGEHVLVCVAGEWAAVVPGD
jgi:hypothetical protein